MKALSIAFLVLSTITASAQPAPSPPDPEARAKELYEQGTKHFNLREYPDAIVAFKEAYRLFSEPLFLFNIAQAYRLSGDCGNAHGFYKTYLRVSPTAADRAKVEKWIAELDACAQAAAAKQPVIEQPVTDKPVTDKPVTDKPVTDKPVTDKPVTDKPVTDKPVTDKPVVGSARSAIIAPAPGSGTKRTLKLAGLATLGGGALLMIGGGVFSFRASGAASDVEALCAASCAGADVAGLDEEGKSAQRTATILYVVGGAATAIGGALFVYATMTGREQALTVTPTAGGAMATAAFRF